MFDDDKADKLMPRKLAEKIERKFNRQENCDAILLLFLWSIFREDISLLSFLYLNDDKEDNKAEGSGSFSEIKLLTHMISANPVYIGHKQLFSDIHSCLEKNSHFIFIQGMGGVGKTESAKQYAKMFADQYDTVVFAECNSSLSDLLIDNTIFTLTYPFVNQP